MPGHGFAIIWDLVPGLGIEPRPSVLDEWSLSHWTREVPTAALEHSLAVL